MINKIEIDSEKYVNDKQKQAYIFNCLNNEGQNMAKIIVLI